MTLSEKFTSHAAGRVGELTMLSPLADFNKVRGEKYNNSLDHSWQTAV